MSDRRAKIESLHDQEMAEALAWFSQVDGDYFDEIMHKAKAMTDGDDEVLGAIGYLAILGMGEIIVRKGEREQEPTP